MRKMMNPVKLNLAVAQVNLNHDSDLIAAIAAVVIEDLPVLVNGLRTAADEKDRQLLKNLAHTIKGLVSNFHAEPLMQLTQKLETEFLLLSEFEIGHLVDEMAIACEQTIGALQVEFQRVP